MTIQLHYPVSDPVCQKFGANPKAYAYWGFPGHEGLDFACSMGTPVRAAADGKVIKSVLDSSEDTRPYGRQVRIISTIDGLQVETAYAHLSQALVKVGQQVKAGDVIGRSGMSGSNGNEPHLHFLVKIQGMQTPGYPAGVVDPEKYLVKDMVQVQMEDSTPVVSVSVLPKSEYGVSVETVNQKPTATMFTGFKEKTLFVDVSRYQTDFDPYKLAANGVFAVVVKGTAGGGYIDPKCREFCAKTRAAGLALGIYPWLDGTFSGFTQAEDAANLINEVKADFYLLDNEQNWSDWDKFYEYRAKKISWSQVPKLTKKQIQRTTVDFLTRFTKLIDLPGMHYTSKGFADVYLTEIFPFIFDEMKLANCIAQYVNVLFHRKITWDQLKAYYPNWTPTLSKGMPAPLAWQVFADRFTLPGSSSEMDVDFFDGNLEGFLSWMRRSALPSPVPLPYVATQLKAGVGALNVREQPSAESKSLRLILPNQEVKLVKDQTSLWKKLFGEAGYVRSDYLAV